MFQFRNDGLKGEIKTGTALPRSDPGLLESIKTLAYDALRQLRAEYETRTKLADAALDGQRAKERAEAEAERQRQAPTWKRPDTFRLYGRI